MSETMLFLRRSSATGRAACGPFRDGLGGSGRRRGLWRMAGLLLALLWLGAIVTGFDMLMRYENRPGAPASAPERWLADAPFALDPARPMLVLFAHPHCPCTRATLGELDRILARCDGRIRAQVVFYCDPSLGADWHHTDLWNQAAGMRGVEVHEDPDAELAHRFGAQTSGQVLLYAPDGALLYQGGITSARGRAGDSSGARNVLALVQDPSAEHASCAVYGCPLTSNPPLTSEESVQ